MDNQKKNQKNTEQLEKKSETIESAEKALKVGVKIKTGIKGGPSDTSNKEWQE